MEKSAVEWLAEELLREHPVLTNHDAIQQAKERERKQKDEYAIEFVNWIVNPDTTDLLHDLEIFGEIDKEVTSKKLLEIYKKEKGL